jgi:murein DD-endopeptidase MepM/ murein hydrolase activator NlpD
MIILVAVVERGRNAFCGWLVLCMTALLPASAIADDCMVPGASDAAQRYCPPRAAESSNGATLEQPSVPLRYLQVIFGFFDRRFPSYNGWLEHAGVDFSAAAGTTVFAICDGTVALTRTDRPEIMSAVLVVEHQCAEPLGKVYAYYGHVHSSLTEGDRVLAGDAIATVRDWGGNSHLHFGLSRRLMEENWGVHPRGATLQGLQELGWLDPLHYFSGVVPAPAPAPVIRRAAPKPIVKRQNRPGDLRGKPRR